MAALDSDFRIEECIIMFLDVHNYSLAFKGLVEDYHFLQEMYEKLGDLLTSAGGEIIKYLGDGMLCTFPAGCAIPAVGCGLEMRRAFAALVAKHGLPEEIVLEVGIGAGKVVTGESGHRSLRQKDIFGEVINHVARIGHYRGVAITEAVYEQVKDRYQAQELPELTTKMPGQVLKAWAVVG